MRRIVFAGAGHANLVALDLLTRRPRQNAEFVLVTETAHARYSGMVPGFIEGLYEASAFSVPLGPFCFARGITLVTGKIESLDDRGLTASGSAIEGDGLVVNLGAVSRPPASLSASRYVPAKPFSALMRGIPEVVDGKNCVIIGAGPAGLEIAFALRARRADLGIVLVERAQDILPDFPLGFRRRVRARLAAAKIELREGAEVAASSLRRVQLTSGETIDADRVLVFTGPAPPPILDDVPFERADDGFIAVDGAMRSRSHPKVLAVGDVATCVDDPRPKAGVFAVRAGPPLARAVADLVAGRPLKPVAIQRRGLVLLATGGRRAIAVRNGITAEGRWVWRLKDRFDRAFVERFRVS